MIGTTISHYRVTSKLGEGGMGQVYRAHDERLNRDVALKVLPEKVAQDAGRLARFEREAKLLASLNHQNIAVLYGLDHPEATVEDLEHDRRLAAAPSADEEQDDPLALGLEAAPGELEVGLAAKEGLSLADRVADHVRVDDALESSFGLVGVGHGPSMIRFLRDTRSSGDAFTLFCFEQF